MEDKNLSLIKKYSTWNKAGLEALLKSYGEKKKEIDVEVKIIKDLLKNNFSE